MDQIHLYPHVPPVSGQPGGSPRAGQRRETADSFSRVLSGELARAEWQAPPLPEGFPLKLSAHAEKRLHSRNIDLASLPSSTLDERLGEAERRGSRSALVVNGTSSLLVNVPGRTVITAFTPDDLSARVITNIDSVIFLED